MMTDLQADLQALLEWVSKRFKKVAPAELFTAMCSMVSKSLVALDSDRPERLAEAVVLLMALAERMRIHLEKELPDDLRLLPTTFRGWDYYSYLVGMVAQVIYADIGAERKSLGWLIEQLMAQIDVDNRQHALGLALQRLEKL